MSLFLITAAGVTLNAVLGGARHADPQEVFGRLAERLEQRLNPAGGGWRSHGVTAWCLAVLPLTLVTWLMVQLTEFGWALEILVLYFALGLRSLFASAQMLAQRLRLGRLSGSEEPLQETTGAASAGVATVLQQGFDSVFAVLFWFVIAGAPGVVLYRLSSVLETAWGAANPRYERFGWAAVKIGHVLGYLPARLTALTYALLGRTRSALRCWLRQASTWPVANIGPVLAAGAGALGITLQGMGQGQSPQARDIERALNRLVAGTVLWLVCLLILELWFA